MWLDSSFFYGKDYRNPSIRNGIDPEGIVFIDEKLHHAEKMMQACRQGEGVKYVEIRFSGADEHVENFDPRIAQQEWEAIDDHQIQSIRVKLQEIVEKKAMTLEKI